MNNPPSIETVAENLFFIVGCGRSGTTLLKTILNAHPYICIPHETFFFESIAKWGENSDSLSRNRKFDRLLSRWWIREMNVSRADLVACLGDSEASWKNILLALLAQQATDDAKSFGEKTVGHVRYAKELLSGYPKSRVIQIIRDPRAVLASFRSTNVGSSYTASIIGDWRRAIRVDRELQEHDRYHRIQYEDLICNTESCAKKLCDFLELSFDPAMLEFHQRRDKGFSIEQKHHENTTRKIFTSGLEAWKGKLSAGKIGLVEAMLGEEMASLGYNLESPHKIIFPRCRFFLSSMGEFLNKQFVRRPKELWKRIRVRKRQNASQ